MFFFPCFFFSFFGKSHLAHSSAVDADDGADRSVGLLFLEGCAETVDTGSAVQAGRVGVVGDGVPVRVDHDRWSGEFVQNLSDDGFHFRGDLAVIDDIDTFFEQGVVGREPSGCMLEEFAVLCSTQCLQRVNGYA